MSEIIFAGLPSIMWRSIKWTNFPSLNNPIAGELGGNGKVNSLAFATASLSTPANTVTKFVGCFSCLTDDKAAGLAFDAAQPQTELITNKVVPSFWDKMFDTSSEVFNALTLDVISTNTNFYKKTDYALIKNILNS